MNHVPHNKIIEAVDALTNIGLCVTPDVLTRAVHGRIYRVGTVDKPKSKNGWFRAYFAGNSDIITIMYGNWSSGAFDKLIIPLKDKSEWKPRTKEERQKLQAEIDAKIKADREKQDRENLDKKTKAVKAFADFNPCQSHPYLERKKISNITHYRLSIDTRANNNLLCIPFFNASNEVQGYQSIDPTGKYKMFNGSVGGYFWRYPLSNPCPDIFTHDNSFYIIGEGLATCLSAYEAITNHFDTEVYLPIILCAFNLGNIEKVIRATKHDKLPYLLLVDNDKSKTKNAGIENARELITAFHDCEIVPLTFSSGDANDFILEHGESAFIDLLNQYAKIITNRIL